MVKENCSAPYHFKRRKIAYEESYLKHRDVQWVRDSYPDGFDLQEPAVQSTLLVPPAASNSPQYHIV